MPKNESSWNAHEKRLTDARTLAEFLDLQSSDVTKFRADHPSFLPPMVWTAFGPLPNSAPGRYPMWMQMQNRLREVWIEGFREKDVLDLISSSNTILDFAIADATTRSDARAIASLDAYRKAILFLYGESWRAKKPCPQCEHHFIANHSQTEFCSVQCSATWRKQYKANRHKRLKDKLNAKRRREYAKRRGA
jgi:hypothetical protein